MFLLTLAQEIEIYNGYYEVENSIYPFTNWMRFIAGNCPRDENDRILVGFRLGYSKANNWIPKSRCKGELF